MYDYYMNKHLQTLFILFPLILVLSFSSIYLDLHKKTIKTDSITEDVKVNPITLARNIVSLIKNKDFISLSEFVDADLGVLISPYYTFGNNQGRKLSKQEVSEFFSDDKKNSWGYQDGSGQELLLTDNEYYEKYIYSGDFIYLGKESINHSLVNGNTLPLNEVINNIFRPQILEDKEIFYVEYYISGFDQKYEGMDWQSLALIFLDTGNNQWVLVGILHNEWTI